MHDEGLLTYSVQPAIAPGPVDPGVTMVLLTDAEREYLLKVVGNEDCGPAATARLKLRKAAPVRDAGWGGPQWKGLFRLFMKLFDKLFDRHTEWDTSR